MMELLFNKYRKQLKKNNNEKHFTSILYLISIPVSWSKKGDKKGE